MFTIFSTAKPFVGQLALVQSIAFDSWVGLGSGIEVLIFGDELGSAEAALSRGFRHFSEVERNEFGTPLLSDIFRKAHDCSSNDILAYINADIILLPEFAEAVGIVFRDLRDALVVSQRIDIDAPINDLCTFPSSRYEKNSGNLYPPYGIDIFVFSRSKGTRLPPFAVGRPYWDNWLIWYWKKERRPVVDITPFARIFHQRHDYSHIPFGDGSTWYGPESEASRVLAHEHCGEAYAYYSVVSADYILNHKGLRRWNVIGRMFRLLAHHPAIPSAGYAKVGCLGTKSLWWVKMLWFIVRGWR